MVATTTVAAGWNDLSKAAINFAFVAILGWGSWVRVERHPAPPRTRSSRARRLPKRLRTMVRSVVGVERGDR